MRTYKVEFYYLTDLRWHEEVQAGDELRALAKALDNLKQIAIPNTWISDKYFSIKIKMVY